MKTLLILLLQIVSLSVFSQSADSSMKIQDFQIDSSGLVKWTTKYEEPNIHFEIKEYRWGKKETIAKIKAKGSGNNSYSWLADTSCGIYQIQVFAYTEISGDDFLVPTTRAIKYPIEKKVDFIGCGPNQRFTTKTRYEVYDSTAVKILSGCDKVIVLEHLHKGIYRLNYANLTSEFIKK